jgi:hypothetical protein
MTGVLGGKVMTVGTCRRCGAEGVRLVLPYSYPRWDGKQVVCYTCWDELLEKAEKHKVEVAKREKNRMVVAMRKLREKSAAETAAWKAKYGRKRRVVK